MSIDYSTFVLLPNAANPAPGMMMEEKRGSPPKVVKSPLKRSLSAKAPEFVPAFDFSKQIESPPVFSRARSSTLGTLYENCEMKYDDAWSSDDAQCCEEDICCSGPSAPPPTPTAKPLQKTGASPESLNGAVYNLAHIPPLHGMSQQDSLLALAIEHRLQQEKIELMAKTIQILRTQEQLRRISSHNQRHSFSGDMLYGLNQNYKRERTMSVDSFMNPPPFPTPMSPIGTPTHQRSTSFNGPAWTPLTLNA